MNSNLNLNELVIIIGAKGLKPYPFNVDFLKQCAIIPEDWQSNLNIYQDLITNRFINFAVQFSKDLAVAVN